MFRFGIMGAGGIAAKFCDAVRRLEGAEVAAVASSWVMRLSQRVRCCRRHSLSMDGINRRATCTV